MVNQKTLTNWILAHRNELDVRVKDCAWIREVFSGWHDLEVSIVVSGRQFVGRGSDQNADIALSKAFCEAVERSVCHSHGISSLGVAGHLTKDAAKENAKLEFVERKTLFDYFSSGIRPDAVSINNKIEQRYSARGVKIQMYTLDSCDAAVRLCIADGLECSNSFGGILGLGAHADAEFSTNKAIIECLRNLEAFLGTPSKSLSCQRFKELPHPTGFDRQALLQDTDYFKNLMASLNTKAQGRFIIGEGGYQILDILDPILASCPLLFFRYVPTDKKSIQLDFVG